MRGSVCDDLPAAPMSSGGDGCVSKYALYDSELLDLMEVAEDTSSFLRARADDSSAPSLHHEAACHVLEEAMIDSTDTNGPKTVNRRAAASLPRLHTSLLVGGSLFARDTPASLSAAFAHGKVPYPTGPVSPAAASVFCPFTRSFVSLCSPHWGQLLGVGFRVHMTLLRGRCVVLQRPPLLLARACQLQGCAMQEYSKIRGTSVQHHSPSSAKPLEDSRCTRTTQERQAALYKKWGWSPHLQQTLGATLSSAPLESVAAFSAAVEADMFAGGFCDSARLIPVTWARDCGAVTSAPFNSQQGTTSTRGGAQNGQAVVRCPWNTRSRVLQAPFSWRLGRRSTSTVVSWVAASASETMWSPLQLPYPLPTQTEACTHRPTLRLFGLPASVRAAFLDVPFPSPSALSSSVTPAALMEAACDAALAQLAGQLRQAVEQGRLAATSRLYFCPLAHAIDYNSTLDLRAYAVEWDQPRYCDGRGGAADTPRVTAALSGSSPVLSLGVESFTSDIAAPADAVAGVTAFTPPLRLVVFSNAHMLSKRAIRRLVDQWTRNGASLHKVREQQSDARAGPRHWRTLMGSRLLLPLDAAAVLSHVRSLSIPFGDVQAVFIGYTASQAPAAQTKVAHPPLDGGTRAPLPLQVSPPSVEPADSPVRVKFAVSASARSDLLYVEEPLSAALLRASTLYRRGLDAAQRRELVEAVTRSIMNGATTKAVFVKRQPQRHRSGRISFKTSEVPLIGTEGRLQVYEACEAVLSLVSPLEGFMYSHLDTGQTPADRPARDDDVVSLLVMYPLLSTLRIRHVLLSAFHVHVALASAARDAAPATMRAIGADRTGAAEEIVCGRSGIDSHPVSTPKAPLSDSRVRFVESRLRANECEERERHRLMQAAAAKVVLTPSCAPRAPLLFQTYAAYVEPAVLRGLWTPTLLFRAPTLEDVMALRGFLSAALQTSYAASHRTPTEAPHRAGSAHGGSAGGIVTFHVDDVDVIHADYADYKRRKRRTDRLLGVRASLRPASAAASHPHSEAGTMGEESLRDVSDRVLVARELALLEALLQQCLEECARTAILFPLWTERRHSNGPAPCSTARQSSEAPGVTASGGRGATGLHLLPFPSVPSCINHRPFLSFPRVMETSTPWTPLLTELRLSCLAAAQRPLLPLTIGSRVVLLESVHVPANDGVDAQDGDAEKGAARSARKRPSGAVFWRGQVCEVAGFAPCDLLLGYGAASKGSEHAGEASSSDDNATCRAHFPGLVQRQVAGWCPTERRLIEQYVAQQRHASSLPLLQCCVAPQARQEGDLGHQGSCVFVLAPRCAVVGGYRSLHYYCLPLLHLPLLVLAGGLARFQPSHSAVSHSNLSTSAIASCLASRVSASDSNTSTQPTLLTATSPSASFDYALSHLLHPHHADPASCRATLCLTSQERHQALELLFAPLCNAAAASSDDAEVPRGNEASPRSSISFVEDVLFSEAAEGHDSGSSASAGTTDSHSSTDTHAALIPPLRCPVLTELALYLRPQ
ncbi:hypothetical protein GH5_07369 [Leishmania sp. Ghana 2012 LV757]|uniref:hypothetical protein n=1 Tax=Leishmania sp. Ghana 2012 LV757 TaxID=2803181 RepID=UPI001B4A8B5C|nr:hypothetical protein GH5_07369 [Leishmania sp. Ghana 2012 LV757]